MASLRILGIDPGLQTTGFGIVDADGSQLRYIASGTIQTHAADKAQLAQRLKIIFDGIVEIHERYQPACAAVEIVFVNVNPKSTLLLGQARGACLSALVHKELPVHEYTALQMKQATTGHGKAAKFQVQEMVMRLLQLNKLPQADASDALGLAITHAHALGSMQSIGKALGKNASKYKSGRMS